MYQENVTALKKDAPIGVFDSGIGGLTVAREIMRQIPNEKIIYFGDTARMPYGSKSKETVTRFSKQIVRFLETFQVKTIVVACNTASAYALDELEKEIDVPIIGVIKPGARTAAEVTRNGRIGVIATEATIGSQMYNKYIQELNKDVTIYGKACPLFVPLVEEGLWEDPVTDEIAKRYLSELIDIDIDTLILGCTHYPLLLDKIRAYLPPSISVVLQGPLVTDRLDDYLKRHPEIESRCSKGGGCRYLTTESPRKFSEAATLFLNEPVEAEHIVLG